jgi:hypothetical protein
LGVLRKSNNFAFFSIILFLIIFGFSYTENLVFGGTNFIEVLHNFETIDDKQILTVTLVNNQQKVYEHVNYDIRAIQSNKVILDEEDLHFHSGQGKFEINSSCSNSDINVTITFHNFGEPPIDFDQNRIFNFSVKPNMECILSVQTDSPSYIKGDPIIISGTAKPLINFKNLVGLESEDCAVVDAFGNPLDNISVDQQVQISCGVANESGKELPFAYVVQIQEQPDNNIVSLAWITGSLAIGQSFNPALSWIPDSPGNYIVTSYLLNSIDESKPLVTPVKFSIKVSTNHPGYAYAGISPYSNTPVSIKIQDPYGNLVGIDQIVPDSSGIFSKGYPSDGKLWKEEGNYKVIALREGMVDEADFSITFEAAPEEPEPTEEPPKPDPPKPNQPPILDYKVDSGPHNVGESIQFDARKSRDSDGSIVKFEWYFNDGESSTRPNPKHTFDKSRTYDVEIKITDDDGAVNKTTFKVKILEPEIFCGPGTWLSDGVCKVIPPPKNGIPPWMIIVAVGGISAAVAGSVIAVKFNGKKPIVDDRNNPRVSSEVHVEIRGGLE